MAARRGREGRGSGGTHRGLRLVRKVCTHAHIDSRLERDHRLRPGDGPGRMHRLGLDRPDRVVQRLRHHGRRRPREGGRHPPRRRLRRRRGLRRRPGGGALRRQDPGLRRRLRLGLGDQHGRR
ncbi:hypothetical protein FRIGORI9N_450068 [Frigoribacterium sp. 9N]|nr:hypothetical protein FRIGORI9N_450068 [Frigoribacterium sp. 9N]